MEIIIGIILCVLIAIIVMMVLTMVYHLFYGIMPVLAIVMIACGLFVGLKCAIKNTYSVFKEVYVKSR